MATNVSDAFYLPEEWDFPITNLEELILKPNISIMFGKEMQFDVLRSAGKKSTCNKQFLIMFKSIFM